MEIGIIDVIASKNVFRWNVLLLSRHNSASHCVSEIL